MIYKWNLGPGAESPQLVFPVAAPAPAWRWRPQREPLDDSATICCACWKPGNLVTCSQCQLCFPPDCPLQDAQGGVELRIRPQASWPEGEAAWVWMVGRAVVRWPSSHQPTAEMRACSARSPAGPAPAFLWIDLAAPGPDWPTLASRSCHPPSVPPRACPDVGSMFKQVITEGKADVQSPRDLQRSSRFAWKRLLVTPSSLLCRWSPHQ